jgi:hypothetical protein
MTWLKPLPIILLTRVIKAQTGTSPFNSASFASSIDSCINARSRLENIENINKVRF